MMSTLKNAALLGLAAGDRVMFAPVSAPTMPYGQVAYGTPGSAVVPAATSAYALSGEAFAQPVEYLTVSETAAPSASSDTQFWLWTGAGALAVLGAAAARGKPSAVAEVDVEVDLESARIAMLAAGGKKKDQPWSLTNFLMGGRKDKFGRNNFELELLSGATRKAADDPSELNARFKIGYDTRSRKVVKPKAKPKAKPVVAWRSKNSSSNLYPTQKKK